MARYGVSPIMRLLIALPHVCVCSLCVAGEDLPGPPAAAAAVVVGDGIALLQAHAASNRVEITWNGTTSVLLTIPDGERVQAIVAAPWMIEQRGIAILVKSARDSGFAYRYATAWPHSDGFRCAGSGLLNGADGDFDALSIANRGGDSLHIVVSRHDRVDPERIVGVTAINNCPVFPTDLTAQPFVIEPPPPVP